MRFTKGSVSPATLLRLDCRTKDLTSPYTPQRAAKTDACGKPLSSNLLFLLLLGLWGRGDFVLFRLDRGITTTDLLPRRSGIVKVSKRLGELKRFIDDPLLFVIVSDLCVALCCKEISLVAIG